MALEEELATYRSRLADLLGTDGGNEGKYVVIRGDEVCSICATLDLALESGYEHCWPDQFMVKKIERVETVARFTRPI